MAGLTEAIKILKQGGIVIYPTDTAFGIGCRIDKPESVARLFAIRKRPLSQATPVLVSSVEMAQKYFLSPIPRNAQQVMDEYWPGALTVVYKCRQELIPPLVRGGAGTIGLRMPNHKTALDLIRGINMPILGPSANFHGQTTPFEYEQLDPQLVKLVDYIIGGECMVRKVSTVLSCTSQPFIIVRQGAVSIDKKYLL